ncbi:MAG: hypothetical protein HY270_18210 [Deltaproteobacteria bacterium]|nr:hypothetical protein [Deltaproteobacteria bacterium]
MRPTTCDPPRHMRPPVDSTSLHRLPIVLLFGTALMLGGQLVSWSDAILGERLAEVPTDEQLIYAPPANFLKFISLGYEHALADVLWFRTLNYFGKHYRSERSYPWLAHMCDRVTDLDPEAIYVYRFAGFLLPWEANEVDAGLELLRKGARNLPDSWELRYILGFSYYFFRDDLEASSRALREAMMVPGVPKFVGELLARVDVAHRGPEGALAFLESMAREGGSPEIREAMREQLRNLELIRDLGALETAVRRFAEERGHPPASLDQLVTSGLVSQLPAEPYGGKYVLDSASGQVVTTSGRKPARLGSSQMRESILRSESPGR